MVRISDLMWYERLGENAPYWFLNLVKYEAETIDDIIAALDVTADYFRAYYYDYDYLPFPVVDYKNIAKDYLVVLNNRKVSDYLKRLPEDKFGSEFERIFHCGFEHDHWWDYFRQRKREILIRWCKENKIPYVDEVKQ